MGMEICFSTINCFETEIALPEVIGISRIMWSPFFRFPFIVIMTSKDNQYWSFLNEQNIEACLKMVNQYDFAQLKLPADVQDFVLDVSASHHCDPKVLFYTVLSGIGHFCETMNVYNLETKQVKPITVYEIIIAPSGM
jgi:hypothetical protein